VLETIPAMIVTQHAGDGKAINIFCAATTSTRHDFATWVAGMPVNMPTHCAWPGYTDLNFLIPELVSRIQYDKGPYYAEDGDFRPWLGAHQLCGSAAVEYRVTTVGKK